MSLPGSPKSNNHMTIASDDMNLEPGDSAKIFPPNSPKRGDLFILTTTVTSDGDLDVQSTLKEHGLKEDVDEVNVNGDTIQAVEAAQPVHTAPPSEECGSVKGFPIDPPTDMKIDLMTTSLQSSLDGEMDTPEKAEALVNAILKEHIEDAGVESSAPQLVQKQSLVGPPPPKPPPPNVKKTHAMPSMPQFKNATLPMQKKQTSVYLEDNILKTEQPKSEEHLKSLTSQKKKNKPFGSMLKSLRKSIKKHTPGGNKGGEPSQVRIQQRSSSSLSSPRIVSSLHISPSHDSLAGTQQETPNEQDTPITRRRRLMDEITDDLFDALPPSPTNSMKNVQDLDSSYANGDGKTTMGDGAVVQEDSICPTEVLKNALVSSTKAAQAKQMMDMITPTSGADVRGQANELPKPNRPRSPPSSIASYDVGGGGDIVEAKVNDFQESAPPPPSPSSPPKTRQSKPDTLNLSPYSNHPPVPPPRPKQPSGGLRSPYVTEQSHDNIISPSYSQNVAVSPIMRQQLYDQPGSSWADNTTSLDRRKIYRNKTETKAIKRSTLGRPLTMHGTTFTNVDKPKYHQLSVDGKMTQKLTYQRTESFQLPKIPFIKHKEKNKDEVVPRPRLTQSSVSGSHRESLMTMQSPTISNECVVKQVNNVESSAQMTEKRFVSIGIQAGLAQQPSPLTTLHFGNATSPTLLEQSKLKSKRRPITPFEQDFFDKYIKISLNNVRVPTTKDGLLSIPFISTQLEERMAQHLETGIQDESTNKSHAAIRHVYSVVSSWGVSDINTSSTSDMQSTDGKLTKQCMIDCLKQYMAASLRLRSADIQGEFSAFHWVCSDVLEAGWSLSGSLDGYPSLQIFYDPVKRANFVQLPRLTDDGESLIYPDYTVDSMLTNWLDVGLTNKCSITCSILEDVMLHPVSAILQLDDFLRQKDSSSCSGLILDCIFLAVLLSIDYCSKSYPSIKIDCSPAQILLVISPANCLVIFKPKTLNQSSPLLEGTEIANVQSLLTTLGFQSCASTEDGLKACQANINRLVREDLNADSLPASLLKAIVPPDWTALAVSRINIGHG